MAKRKIKYIINELNQPSQQAIEDLNKAVYEILLKIEIPSK